MQLKDVGWEDDLPDNLETRLCDILKMMVIIKNLDFPQSVKPDAAVGPLELGVFWDGGNLAFGEAVYSRCQPTEPGDSRQPCYSD